MKKIISIAAVVFFPLSYAQEKTKKLSTSLCIKTKTPVTLPEFSLCAFVNIP